MQLIDGKATAATIKKEIAEEVERIVAAGGKRPHLAAVLVGHDGGSETYVRNKVKACEECGFTSTLVRYEADVTEAELLACIDRLNRDADVDGFIVQLPLPPHIDEQRIIEAIDYRKDVDGFHPVNVAKLVLEEDEGFVPCTPLGCMELLKAYGIETAGKHAVVIGRSMIVGKPMANLLVSKKANATVTIAHSRTSNLAEICRSADIIVAAVGRPKMVTADFIKPGAVVLDVGINRVPDASTPKGYRIVGDVDFENVRDLCSAITPVPGGVGPMTIAMLMANTVKACRQLTR